MKLWLLAREECGYDEFDAFVIRAETAAEALAIAKAKEQRWGLMMYGHEADDSLTCTELLVDGEPGVVLGSFQAG